MDPYRLKFRNTDLYYKPGCPNLSKKGKVYFTASNGVERLNRIPVTLNKGTKLHKEIQSLGIMTFPMNSSYKVAFWALPSDFTREFI